jgi:hypothetical protein
MKKLLCTLASIAVAGSPAITLMSKFDTDTVNRDATPKLNIDNVDPEAILQEMVDAVNESWTIDKMMDLIKQVPYAIAYINEDTFFNHFMDIYYQFEDVVSGIMTEEFKTQFYVYVNAIEKAKLEYQNKEDLSQVKSEINTTFDDIKSFSKKAYNTYLANQSELLIQDINDFKQLRTDQLYWRNQITKLNEEKANLLLLKSQMDSADEFQDKIVNMYDNMKAEFSKIVEPIASDFGAQTPSEDQVTYNNGIRDIIKHFEFSDDETENIYQEVMNYNEDEIVGPDEDTEWLKLDTAAEQVEYLKNEAINEADQVTKKTRSIISEETLIKILKPLLKPLVGFVVEKMEIYKETVNSAYNFANHELSEMDSSLSDIYDDMGVPTESDEAHEALQVLADMRDTFLNVVSWFPGGTMVKFGLDLFLKEIPSLIEYFAKFDIVVEDLTRVPAAIDAAREKALAIPGDVLEKWEKAKARLAVIDDEITNAKDSLNEVTEELKNSKEASILNNIQSFEDDFAEYKDYLGIKQLYSINQQDKYNEILSILDTLRIDLEVRMIKLQNNYWDELTPDEQKEIQDKYLISTNLINLINSYRSEEVTM